MSPLWLLVPLGGALVWVLVAVAKAGPPPPEYTPPPPGPAGTATRALTYLQRIEAARATWLGARFIPGAGEALRSVLLSTLDVVVGMADTDRAAGRIGEADMAAIKARADAIKSEAAPAKK